MRDQHNILKIYPSKKSLKYHLIAILFFFNTAGFAQDTLPSHKKITNTIYFIANTGMDSAAISTKILETINRESQANPHASVVVGGNFTQRNGYPKKGKERKKEERYLTAHLLKPLKGFNGDIILTPGPHEWNKGGQDNIDDMESFLQDHSKAKFWPNDGCPLEHESLGDNVELIMVNSEWYLQNWDDQKRMNHKCDIKTRDQFFLEFQDDVKDAQGKTVIVAVYNPILTDTKPGFINRIDGMPQESYYSVQQREFHNRLETIGREFDDVIFVSGDPNLQYLDHHGVPQIMSGAAAKTEPAKIHKKGHFASDKHGYAKLEVFNDNSSRVYFYEVDETGTQSLLFTKDIPRQRTRLSEVSYKDKNKYGKTETASIYTQKETDKSGFYTWLWGDHYRNIYSRKIKAPVLFLDDLPGNIEPVAEGGGHQSVTLHLTNDEGKEFTLRALRKSALSYLQYSIKDHYVKDFLVNTWAERVVQDYYTTAHPYAPYASFDLMDDLNLYNTGPKVYYVPKQKRLGIFNDKYGDALYMFEQHAGDENKDSKIFGKPDDILSTADLLKKLNKSKEAFVDQKEYIKARLFDMLIGDWDRHYDQWRWAEFEQPDGRKKYEPIPRDRDQAFPKYDGILISLIKLGVPSLRIMQSYGPELKDVKWFNMEPYPLDKKLITTANWNDWKEEVDTIQTVLTDEKIDAAFANLPHDMQDESIKKIKASLKERRGNLLKIAQRYYDFLKDRQVITGTEKDDEFKITRKEKGITQIEIFRKDSLIFKNSYTAQNTKEIWIYGLDGDDTFHINGKGDHLIKLKILGGEEHDVYDFKNTRKAKLYDFKSKKSTIVNPASHKWLVDSYDINNYDYTKPKYNQNTIYPLGGFSSDSGVHLGIGDTYTTYGLANNPFRTQHSFSAKYYFPTQGIELKYSGEFANIFYKWNFGIDLLYTSPSFTLNYFGRGNETIYDKKTMPLDYNRVNTQQLYFAPSLIWRNERGSKFYIKPFVQSIQVTSNGNRLISDEFSPQNPLFDRQYYAGGELNYQYLNKDNNPAFPNRGMQFDLTTGYKTNIDEHTNEFGYIKPSLSIDYPVHPSGVAVLATIIGGEAILGQNYEFYDGATLGGKKSLRAYRNERFNGKTSFFQSTDLRVGFAKFRTNFIPIRMGATLGFDYGRVWIDNQDSNHWHTDYGASLFVNGFSAFTGNVGWYKGDDGGRLIFTFGFKF